MKTVIEEALQSLLDDEEVKKIHHSSYISPLGNIAGQEMQPSSKTNLSHQPWSSINFRQHTSTIFTGGKTKTGKRDFSRGY